MRDEDRSDGSGYIICDRCGTRNHASASYCTSCGASFDTPDASGRSETIIDVSDNRPRIITSNEEGTGADRVGRVHTIHFEQGRVIVARGGSWTCLLVTAVVVLLLCCVCWSVWTSVGSVV